MKQQLNDIIRSQWPKRHSANEHTRTRARNLIEDYSRQAASNPSKQACLRI